MTYLNNVTPAGFNAYKRNLSKQSSESRNSYLERYLRPEWSPLSNLHNLIDCCHRLFSRAGQGKDFLKATKYSWPEVLDTQYMVDVFNSSAWKYHLIYGVNR